jgi:hypothetical protein
MSPAVVGAFPYNIDNLLGGAVRLLYAPTSVAIPEGIEDVISMVSPYTAKTGWVDIGATRDSFTYTRGFEVSGWEIQQTAGNVIEEVSSITRTVTLSLAEFRTEILELVEESQSVDTVAAAADVGAQHVVRFGSFTSLGRHRIAFICRRSRASGEVLEDVGGLARGAFVMGVGYTAQISAEDATIEFDKGALSAAGVGFTFFPASDLLQGEEYGAWFMEDHPATLT